MRRLLEVLCAMLGVFVLLLVAVAVLVLVNGGDHPLVWSRPQAFRRAANSFPEGL